MAIQIVSQTMIADLAQERVVFMNSFGTEHQLYIPLTKVSERDAIITAKTAELQTVEDQFRQYVLDHYNQAELDRLLAAGASIIATRKAKG